MKTYKEQICYGMKALCADERDNYPTITAPYVQGDWVCATDTHILLIMPKSDDILQSFAEIEGHHPNALAVIDPETVKGLDWSHHIFMSDIEACDKPSIQAIEAGRVFRTSVLKQVAKWARCFGIVTLDATLHGQLLLLRGFTKGGMEPIYCGVMGLAAGAEAKGGLITWSGPASNGNTIDLELGSEAYHTYLAEDAAREAAENIRNFKCWEVRFVQYATIAVRAETEDEAKEIAQRSFDSNFFDGCYEIEDAEESCRDYLCDGYEVYYDADGEQDWEEDNEDE